MSSLAFTPHESDVGTYKILVTLKDEDIDAIELENLAKALNLDIPTIVSLSSTYEMSVIIKSTKEYELSLLQ